ncbi:autoinducer binding domain-containing protein [Pseudomonas asplenii]|uniref:helix-turn-helix transcriptional regulator n=1 Tax=Pseudomonas asplenii TaxID=53407 RepID=UPI0004981CB6
MLFMDECLELLSAADAKTWFQSLALSARKLGYNRVLYALKPNKETPNNTAEIMSNYPDDWRHRYDNEKYAWIDPTVCHSFSSSLPIAWEEKLYKTPKEKEFAEEARQAGLSHGMTLPIHGPQGQVGMLSLSCDPMSESEYQKTLKHNMGSATLLRDYAVTSSSNHFLQGSGYLAPRLTPREQEILHWTWAEKTTWEIGQILSLSEPTVEFHVKNIRRKLNVTSRRLAVARAIQLDLISP